MAYLQSSSLKRRVDKLEEQLAVMEGSPLNEDRKALQKAATSYIGRKVKLEMKEDHMDVDIVMYGNTKHGSNTIIDADEEWLLVHIVKPKGEMDKLIRLASVSSISEVQE
ncbi:MAG: hypothetical protein IKS99_03190 [Firmicutes bacterium]|nr:hypothetical protein [Bacillota bacterium]